MNRRWNLVAASLALLALAQCFFAAHAQAAVTCNVTMDNLVFTPDFIAGTGLTASGTLTYNCTSGNLLATSVRVCFDVGDGVQGMGNFNPRVMTDGAGDSLTFQLYQSPGYTIVWGSEYNAITPTPYVATKASLGLLGTFSGSVPMQGRLGAGQTTAPPGSYKDQFSGNHTAVTIAEQSGSTVPASCSGSESTTFPFTVSATIAKSCVVTANDMNFTAADFLTANIDNATTLQTTCTSGTAYQIGLGNGANASGTTRRMAGGSSEFVRYELYRDSSRTQRWGNTLNTDTVSANGNGLAQTTTIYGRVPAQTTPSPSSYSDTITVTVTY